MKHVLRQCMFTLICVILALSASGCSKFDALSVDALPLPGSIYSGYEIVAEFDNVLNLPGRAKVKMLGTTVGEVRAVSQARNHVDVTARIEHGVQVPSNTTAVLQQATVLGDIYVALVPPEDDAPPGPPLAPGERIPLAQTVSPPQIEDTIANLANFIGSGSIQRAQNTLLRLNRITPPKPELERVVTQVTTDINEVAADIDTADTLLSSLEQTSNVAAWYESQMSYWFTPEGVEGFRRSTLPAGQLGKLLPSIGTIYSGGYWLVPALSSLADAMESVKGAKHVVEDEYPKWRTFINEYFLPQEKYPAINITSIVGPDGRELSGNVQQVLRMLGAVP